MRMKREMADKNKTFIEDLLQKAEKEKRET